jgi:hypothetical protein
MTQDHDPARRSFLVAGAAVAGASSVTAAGESLLGEVGANTVLLHDPRIRLPVELTQRLTASGARIVPIDGDVVRMWRGGIGQVLADPATRLLGITRWPDLLMVRGLAFETRRYLRQERFDAGSDSFIWLIA